MVAESRRGIALAAYKVRMQLRNFTIPEVAAAFSEIQLVAPDTVEFSRATMPEATALFVCSTASSIRTDGCRWPGRISATCRLFPSRRSVDLHRAIRAIRR